MASATESTLAIDLVVDTSAVMAVLLQEPLGDAVLERLCQAAQPALAAPTRTDILVVALAKLGEIGLERTAAFLDQQAIATVACDKIWRMPRRRPFSVLAADATPAHSTLGTASPTPWPTDCRCHCCSWATISAAPICGRRCESAGLH
jgi:hypothetical protein